MTRHLIFTVSTLFVIVLLALCSENITIYSKAFAQFPVSNVKPDISAATSTNASTITLQTTNSIQGSSFNLVKLLPVIRKAILSNIDNAIFMAKGSVKSTIPVNVNARIINQLANRIDTTQGIDMTKRLIATELTNAINTTTTNSNIPFHLVQQQTNRVTVDDQAVCTGIASASKAACSFTINIHK
jgi:hypothetical protein